MYNILLILALTLSLVSIIIAIIAKTKLNSIKSELNLFRNKFRDEVGKLLHETEEERILRETNEKKLRQKAQVEQEKEKELKAKERDDKYSSYSFKSESYEDDSDWCYEKGDSPGGGCVGK